MTTAISLNGEGSVGSGRVYDLLVGRVGNGFFVAVALSVLGFLYLPITVLVIFSFNDSRILSLPMRGFTLRWYETLFANSDLWVALGNSLYVASTATSLTLIIGIPAAFALQRIEFPGKTIFRRIILLPIALPGIITGISMLNFFRVLGINLSLETVILGHATALIAIVITQVFARLQRLGGSMQEAAADLGARPWQTFILVTLPNIRTAIIGSALLSFSLSFDEIPITFFLTGRDNTLPMYIWSTLRRGITPEINAIGSIIILFSVGIIILSIFLLHDSDDGKK